MSYQLSIGRREWTASGVTLTVQSIAPNGTLYDYFPSSPPIDVTWTQGETVGSWPVAHRVGNAVESCKVNFYGDNVMTALRTLNQAFMAARLWAESSRKDLEYVLRFRDSARHGVNEWYESRLYGGRVTLERGHVLNVTWERAPYWEGDEVIVQVKRRDNTTFADYAQITNCEDTNPARSNVLRVQTPAGDAPTPVRIRLNNDYDSDARLARVMIHWFPEGIATTLEADAAEPMPELVPDEGASNGNYGVGTSFTWSVAHSIMRNYTGWFRMLVNGHLRGEWELGVGYELRREQTNTITGSPGWNDFGLFYLPPRGYMPPVRYPIRVRLAGASSSSVDYVLLLPVYGELAQWRVWGFDGFNAIQGTCIEDDMRRMDVPVLYEFGGENLPLVNAYGGPIELWPAGLPGGGYQSMVFALENDTGAAEALRTAQVQLFARPRYANLP
ncbi:MAG: hypothetical protein JXR84_04140 [Anaerolineae bacterium]|nr:hypothetical protein [Anaerolineae bacterium]